MVNWNNESIVTIRTQELYEKCVLEKWYNVLEGFEHYEIKDAQGILYDIAKVKARLKTLFRVCYGDFPKEMDKDDIDKLQFTIYNSNDLEELEICFLQIIRFLTEINVLGSKREKIMDSVMQPLEDDEVEIEDGVAKTDDDEGEFKI